MRAHSHKKRKANLQTGSLCPSITTINYIRWSNYYAIRISSFSFFLCYYDNSNIITDLLILCSRAAHRTRTSFAKAERTHCSNTFGIVDIRRWHAWHVHSDETHVSVKAAYTVSLIFEFLSHVILTLFLFDWFRVFFFTFAWLVLYVYLSPHPLKFSLCSFFFLLLLGLFNIFITEQTT